MEDCSSMLIDLPDISALSPFPIADTLQEARGGLLTWDDHNLEEASIDNWRMLSIHLIQAICKDFLMASSVLQPKDNRCIL